MANNTHTDFEYMEVILTYTPPISQDDYTSYTYDIPKDMFDGILQKMKATHYKYFQHDVLEKVLGNLVLSQKIEDGHVVETKVHHVTPLQIYHSGAFVTVMMEKQKLASIMFPSVMRVDDEKMKRKLVFRINNKIYVNFQQEYSPISPNHIIRKIYINFNNSKHADVKESMNIIENLKKLFN